MVETLQQQGINMIIWFLAAAGFISLFGKNIGHAVIHVIFGGQKMLTDAIPWPEIRENIKVLIKQGNDIAVSEGGKAAMDALVARICLAYPVTAGVVRPLAQSIFDEMKKEINASNQSVAPASVATQ